MNVSLNELIEMKKKNYFNRRNTEQFTMKSHLQ